MGRSFAGSFEADIGSTEGSHSAASDSFSNVAPDSMNEEQMASAGSAADADDVLAVTKLNVESADLTRHDLAIVIHASHSFEHGRDDSDAVDSDAVPLSFSVPQMVLTSGAACMFHSVPTPLCCMDREYIYTYFECCVLICRRLWCPYGLCYGGSFSLWSHSSSWYRSGRWFYHTGQPYYW